MENTSVWYDAQAGVFANGNVSIVPEVWEHTKDPVTPSGGTMSSVGRMVMSSNGCAQFVPYNHNTEPRFKLLASSEHGRVKRFDRNVVIEFKFARKEISVERATTLVLNEMKLLTSTLWK